MTDHPVATSAERAPARVLSEALAPALGLLVQAARGDKARTWYGTLAADTAGVDTGSVTPAQLDLVASDPQVLSGQAVLAGTRVPVSVVLDCLAAGMTAAEIVTEYPSVTEPGIRAAAAYGALLARDELVPILTAE